MSKLIKLSQGMVAIVDEEDFDRVSQFKWYYNKKLKDNTGYAVRHIVINGKKKLQQMHRFILRLDQVGMHVDHIDANGLNNTKHNLRLCTHSQNQQNMQKPKNNTSGFKGVSWNKRDQKWRANITINHKNIHIGRFDTIFDAANAYNKKAIELFGEFANINKV